LANATARTLLDHGFVGGGGNTDQVEGVPNAAPTIAVIPPITLVSDGGETKVSFAGLTTGAASEKQRLTVTAVSDNPSLLPDPVVSYLSPSAQGELALKAIEGTAGQAVVTVTVLDDGGTLDGGMDRAAVQFVVTVKSEALASIYFQHKSGGWGMWKMRAEQYRGAAAFEPGQPASANARVVAVADFDGDGQRDLLTQDGGGEITVNFLSGTAVLGAQSLSPSHTGDLAWKVAGAGDLDHDGKNDVIFQHDEGTLAVWFLDGVALTSSSLLSPSNPGDGWRLMGVGDLNQDGEADLVFQHRDGSVATWLMNGTGLKEPSWIVQANEGSGLRDIKVRGLTDLDLDGTIDILLQGADESLYVWFLDGTTVRAGTSLDPNKASPGWRIVGP
ncbi:MAG: VCBS repeat-containing protein, partial [Verrucomicrobia bacterium]|nr:VCBS repeat-containing protein [Verrucomicrobiota bacterium]